jgi:hypothetical protein
MSSHSNQELVGFRRYRKIHPKEFFVVFMDTAQGGTDKNYIQCISKTRMDVPIVFSMRGAATEATPFCRQLLQWIHEKTDVKPVIGVERQNGGTSVMIDLINTNQGDHYTPYFAKKEDGSDSDKPGWDTNSATRPKMLGEWLTAFDGKLIALYDAETIAQHQTFIVNKRGRPEAAPNTHDDAVMSLAGAYQLYQTEQPPEIEQETYNTGELETAWLGGV